MTDDLEAPRRITTERWAKWFSIQPGTENYWWQRWRGPQNVPTDAPTKVTWTDIGQPEKPGSYAFLDGQIAIGQREIAIWRENPTGIFLVGVFRSKAGPVYYSPGTYLKPAVEQPMATKITARIGSWKMLRNEVRKAYARWRSSLG